MSIRPPPMLPEDTDVTGMPGFIIDVERLLMSEFNLVASAEEKWAALMLWCRAYQPAGSLPLDQRTLAGLSGDPRNWKRVKAMALRGWVECNNDRLYHPVLSHYIAIASAAKRKGPVSSEGQNARQSRWRDNLREMSGRLRSIGITPPPGASLSTMKRLLVDAEAIYKASQSHLHEIGSNVEHYPSRDETLRLGTTNRASSSEIQTYIQRGSVPDDGHLDFHDDLDGEAFQ